VNNFTIKTKTPKITTQHNPNANITAQKYITKTTAPIIDNPNNSQINIQNT
jgi:hypothetical protein